MDFHDVHSILLGLLTVIVSKIPITLGNKLLLLPDPSLCCNYGKKLFLISILLILRVILLQMRSKLKKNQFLSEGSIFSDTSINSVSIRPFFHLFMPYFRLQNNCTKPVVRTGIRIYQHLRVSQKIITSHLLRRM